MYGKIYYKITNQEECHRDFQYQTGLNVLDRPFQENGSCVAGGLYFTTLEHLHDFYQYGVWLRVVIIPDDALMVKDPAGNKWRADKIILGERYPLYDLGTIKKFNLKINEYFICLSSGRGCLDVLEWWLKTNNEAGLELKYDWQAVNYASSESQFKILDWWLKAHQEHGLELKYSSWAIGDASSNGHVNTLEWWRNSGLDLKYSYIAIDKASANGHINVLEWWKSSKLPMKYGNVMKYASMNGHVEVLEWWNNSGLDLKYNEHAMEYASRNGHVNVLEWWKNSGLDLKYDECALFIASCNGHVSVLEWWKNSGLKLKYSQNSQRVTTFYNDDIVEWWDSNLT